MTSSCPKRTQSISFASGSDIPDEWELFHSLDDDDYPCFSAEEEQQARKEMLNDIYEGLYE